LHGPDLPPPPSPPHSPFRSAVLSFPPLLRAGRVLVFSNALRFRLSPPITLFSIQIERLDLTSLYTFPPGFFPSCCLFVSIDYGLAILLLYFSPLPNLPSFTSEINFAFPFGSANFPRCALRPHPLFEIFCGSFFTGLLPSTVSAYLVNLGRLVFFSCSFSPPLVTISLFHIVSVPTGFWSKQPNYDPFPFFIVCPIEDPEFKSLSPFHRARVTFFFQKAFLFPFCDFGSPPPWRPTGVGRQWLPTPFPPLVMQWNAPLLFRRDVPPFFHRLISSP